MVIEHAAWYYQLEEDSARLYKSYSLMKRKGNNDMRC